MKEWLNFVKVLVSFFGPGVESNVLKVARKYGEEGAYRALTHALSSGLEGGLHYKLGYRGDNYRKAMYKYLEYLSSPEHNNLIDNNLLKKLVWEAEGVGPEVRLKVPELEKLEARLYKEGVMRDERLNKLRKRLDLYGNDEWNYSTLSPRYEFKLSDYLDYNLPTTYNINNPFDNWAALENLARLGEYKHGGNLTMSKNLTTLFLDYLKKGGVMKALPGNKINSKPRITIDDKEIERRARKKWEQDSVIINNGYDDLHYANNGHKGEIDIDKYGDDKWHPNKKLYREEERKKVQKKQPGGWFEDPYAIAELENNRNAEISRQYFNSTPSIGNLVKGVYYWWKSLPFLGGETGSITGTAPVVGSTNGVSLTKLPTDLLSKWRSLNLTSKSRLLLEKYLEKNSHSMAELSHAVKYLLLHPSIGKFSTVDIQPGPASTMVNGARTYRFPKLTGEQHNDLNYTPENYTSKNGNPSLYTDRKIKHTW